MTPVREHAYDRNSLERIVELLEPALEDLDWGPIHRKVDNRKKGYTVWAKFETEIDVTSALTLVEACDPKATLWLTRQLLAEVEKLSKLEHLARRALVELQADAACSAPPHRTAFCYDHCTSKDPAKDVCPIREMWGEFEGLVAR